MRRFVAAATLAASLGGGLTACNGGSAGDQPPPEPFGTRAATTVLKDAVILAAVKTKLTADDLDSTTTLGLSVVSGVVTLRGSVRTAADRAKAVSDARTVPGVRRVVDDLQVNASGPHPQQQLDDLGLDARIEAAILAQVGYQRVTVHASRGVVTLTGTVADDKTRGRIAAAARGTDGVRNVVDQVRVGGT
jgi:hyperosmotically inducible protein